jgi:hypothetical protein
MNRWMITVILSLLMGGIAIGGKKMQERGQPQLLWTVPLEGRTQVGNLGGSAPLLFSQDGQGFALLSDGNSDVGIWLFDTQTGKHIKTPRTSQIGSLSPDGTSVSYQRFNTSTSYGGDSKQGWYRFNREQNREEPYSIFDDKPCVASPYAVLCTNGQLYLPNSDHAISLEDAEGIFEKGKPLDIAIIGLSTDKKKIITDNRRIDGYIGKEKQYFTFSKSSSIESSNNIPIEKPKQIDMSKLKIDKTKWKLWDITTGKRVRIPKEAENMLIIAENNGKYAWIKSEMRGPSDKNQVFREGKPVAVRMETPTDIQWKGDFLLVRGYSGPFGTDAAHYIEVIDLAKKGRDLLLRGREANLLENDMLHVHGFYEKATIRNLKTSRVWYPHTLIDSGYSIVAPDGKHVVVVQNNPPCSVQVWQAPPAMMP